ncbi:MAG: Ycf66 family protein [Trichocoleus desertorum ATA4-8-CV12]|jgi:hypothetical protein|nr:Ycf66 family protein [Trichocoleus desertorum ATA4-8-CV12]
MVNIGISVSSLLGIFLCVLGVILPLLSLVLLIRNPRRGENLLGLCQDICLGVVYLLSGGILFFQGWRQDPLLQFAQLLIILALTYLSLKDLFLRFRR